jgi:hypothetical protein
MPIHVYFLEFEIDVLGVELFQYLSNLPLVSLKPAVAVEARNHQPRLRTIDSSICGPNDVLPQPISVL